MLYPLLCFTVYFLAIYFFVLPNLIRIAEWLIPETSRPQRVTQIIMAVTLSLSQWCNPAYISIYNTFTMVLFIVIITDISTLLISRWTTLYLVPIGWLCAYYDLLYHAYLPHITLTESITASIIGYGGFALLNKIFFYFKKENGLGEGDWDLLALIGAFTGYAGIWYVIFWGSLWGTIVALIIQWQTKQTVRLLPFGPFLCIGAIGYISFDWLMPLLLYGFFFDYSRSTTPLLQTPPSPEEI